MGFSMTSFLFQFPWADHWATPGAYWYGLKRPGFGVPDPFADATSDANLNEVEGSIKGFCTCLWLAALYGYVSRRGALQATAKLRKSNEWGIRMEKVEEVRAFEERSN